MMTLLLTNLVRCAIYNRKMDEAVHFIFKTLPQCHSRVRCVSDQRQLH